MLSGAHQSMLLLLLQLPHSVQDGFSPSGDCIHPLSIKPTTRITIYMFSVLQQHRDNAFL